MEGQRGWLKHYSVIHEQTIRPYSGYALKNVLLLLQCKLENKNKTSSRKFTTWFKRLKWCEKYTKTQIGDPSDITSFERLNCNKLGLCSWLMQNVKLLYLLAAFEMESVLWVLCLYKEEEELAWQNNTMELSWAIQMRVYSLCYHCLVVFYAWVKVTSSVFLSIFCMCAIEKKL